MSNKKSRKLINIMLSAMMLLGAANSYGAPNNTSNLTQNDKVPNVGTSSPTSYGKIDGGIISGGKTGSTSGTNSSYGKNGVAYVLLSSDFSNPGVYRYNKFDGSIRDSYKSKNLDPKSPLFKINTINGKVSGLAANQKNDVYLLSAIEGEEFNDAPIGWLPTGIKFDENSSIYLAVAGPSDGGATDYLRDGYPSWHSWPTDGKPNTGQYWKRDQTYKGKTYEYAVNFGGPVGVKFLNGVDNTDGTGCPIWDGTYKPESTSNAAAIRHPSDPQKVLLPSHVGALSYYLYGTKNETAIEGKPMDGTDGRDTYIFSQANGAGVFSGDSKHGYGTMFGCIVRRFYQKRENSLNLYSGNDTTTASNIPFDQTMTQTQANVLKTVDVKVKEAYGKLCGDNCIDGGEILGKPVETAISTVTVVTSTTGNRYGFNPLGVFKGSNSTDASLRVVKSNGTTQTIDIATDDEGTKFSNKITNTSYLMSKEITPASIKTIGISSRFGSSNDLDYIYGSGADYFVVQDSWWGKGGVAYEYYKGTDGNPGKVVKIDYVNKDNQTESEELGDLEGNIDAIAIDGDGFLYALKTEQSPADSTMEAISFDPNPTTTEVGNDKLQVSYTEWRRDKQTTTANDETINDSYEVIPDGEEQPGDYKIATIVQNVFKTVKRYPQATGALGTEEDRGTMWAGHDEWINRLKKTSSGYAWDYPLWRQSEGTKASSLHGELAVVNVADSPVSVDGTTDHYIVVTGATNEDDSSYTYTNNQVIKEQSSLTFKVEGYKPVVGGEQRKFKDIGDISDTYKNVKLNNIPAEDGTYAHDEDGDNNKSGFPSSMFEAKNYNTTVKWKIALVEDTSATEIGSSKQAGKLIDPADDKEKDVITISGTGDYKSLTYKFNQPGRYIIQAEVTYNYFDNFGSAERPTDLTSSTKSFTTKPKLIQVDAKSLRLNETTSYITNIKLTNDNPGNKNYGVTGGSSNSMFDAVEGPINSEYEKAGKFGPLTISFEAQFYREEENNTTGDFQTYDGIGVWDYQYYKELYKKVSNKYKDKTAISDFFIDNLPTTSRAYNHIGDPTGSLDSIDLTSAYNPNVYNPGKNKGDSTDKHKAGTQVTGKPNSTDLSFIQYAIYLRPVTPQGSVSVNPKFERGDLIASGSFKDATVSDPISNRKFNITKTINCIDTKINTPRDPFDYTLDLEIVYPRVTWLNNDLGANDGKTYFSSIVPYTPATKQEPAPIHVLSKLKIDGSTNNIINQSYENVFADNAYYTVCARDREIPELINNKKDLYHETTGDPTISGDFAYQVKDNNPYLSIKNNPEAKITEEDALSRTDLMTQDIVINKFITSKNSEDYYKKPSDGGNIKYSVKTDIVKTATIDQTPDDNGKIDDKCFCATDSWRIWIDYTAKMNSLSPERFRPHTKAAEAALTARIDELYMENWVGTLSYSIVGMFFDGLGEDTQSSVHYIGNSDVLTNDSDLPSYMSGINTVPDKAIEVATSPYLVRIDNDPPNIEVELVSQSDNRRWNYQLIEDINDQKSDSDDKMIKLSPSTLVVKQYKLSEATSAIGSYEVKNIAGTTAYKDNVYDAENSIGTMTVDLHKSQFDSIPTPSFRRAARLLINVNIFDNCGYLPLKEAWIEVSDNNGNSTALLPKKDIDPTACYNEEGKLTKFKANEKPRGIFYVNLPMQVAEGQDTNPQITVKVHAEDQEGNARELVIPVKLVESTFETRVLETKEERQ